MRQNNSAASNSTEYCVLCKRLPFKLAVAVLAKNEGSVSASNTEGRISVIVKTIQCTYDVSGRGRRVTNWTAL